MTIAFLSAQAVLAPAARHAVDFWFSSPLHSTISLPRIIPIWQVNSYSPGCSGRNSTASLTLPRELTAQQRDWSHRKADSTGHTALQLEIALKLIPKPLDKRNKIWFTRFSNSC